VSVRETAAGEILVAGAHEEACASYAELMWCLERGAARRATGRTLANARSSRSHAIFSVLVETSSARDRRAGRCRLSKLHLVDLAGSERNKRTQTTGLRFQEAIKINSGLLALSNVISALSQRSDRGGAAQSSVHVPYRDSKLTRMLQDSLGRNAHTCMIACVGPHELTLEETLSTLKYAGRTRHVINTPKVNTSSRRELDRMRASVALSTISTLSRRSMQLEGAQKDPELLAVERALEAERASAAAAADVAVAAAPRGHDPGPGRRLQLQRLRGLGERRVPLRAVPARRTHLDGHAARRPGPQRPPRVGSVGRAHPPGRREELLRAGREPLVRL
jgi:hypothetical protein